MDKARILVLVLVGFASLFGIISTATTGWVTSNNLNLGLFRGCVSGTCRDIEPDCGGNGLIIPDCTEYNAARAFSVMGLIFGVGALILALLAALGKGLSTKIEAALNLVSGFCIFLAMCIYAGWFNDQPGNFGDLGYSFALCVIAWLLYVGAGVFLLVGGSKLNESTA